jgi:hypothetical protein
MKFYTDYPINGYDEPYKEAPIREVTILGYDQDKYADVLVIDLQVKTEIKIGYIYKSPGRLGEVQSLSHKEVMDLFNEV